MSSSPYAFWRFLVPNLLDALRVDAGASLQLRLAALDLGLVLPHAKHLGQNQTN
jgi:hypothetical protein